MYDPKCKIHQDADCKICDKYELTVNVFIGNGIKTNTMEFWVGQDAGTQWGSFGDEGVSLKYIAGVAPIGRAVG